LQAWKAKSILFFGTIIWGATFLFTEIGLRWTSPTLYIVIRFSIALVLCLLFFGKYVIRTSRNVMLQGALLGVFFSVGFLLQTFGLKYTTINNTAFITSLNVVLTPFVYWCLSRDKMTIYQKIAIVIGFIGVLIITDPGGTELNFGDILVVFSTLGWALYASFIHRFTLGHDEFSLSAQLLAFQFAAGLFILLGYMFLFDFANIFFVPTTELIISILFNSLMASFLVSFLQIAVQRYTTPTNAALIFSLEPVFASILAYIVLSEVLSGRQIIGGLVMLLAVLSSDTLGIAVNKIRLKMQERA
jgi:drug/metabolite transporter (DMT)-like permease